MSERLSILPLNGWAKIFNDIDLFSISVSRFFAHGKKYIEMATLSYFILESSDNSDIEK